MGVDQSRWRYVVTDMSGGTTAGGGPVLNTSQKQFSHSKNGGKTAQFTLNIDNPKASYILSNDCLLKVYRRTRLTGQWQRLMVGDIIHAEEDGQGDTGLVTVVAADPWWRFQRRIMGLGVDALGRGTGFTDGSATGLVDIGQILVDMINAQNAGFNTGVSVGTLQPSTTGFIGPVYAQFVGDLFQQLCATLGGPDFEIVPLEPSGFMPNTIIGQMNVWAALGSSRPNTFFEYGTGRYNVATYSRILSKDGLCNEAISLPQGFPDLISAGDNIITAQDSGSMNSIGLYQDIVPSDVVSRPLRQELANEYITVRAHARQQITFTPTVDCPYDYGVDYNVGDTVQARAFVNGGYRYNGSVRIYGVDIAVDDNDAETPALTLIPPGS